MSRPLLWGLSVLIVGVGGYGYLLFAYLFSYFSCSWDGSCSIRQYSIFAVLLAGGVVGMFLSVRAVWRRS